MTKELVLKIIESENKEQTAERIVELYKCVKSKTLSIEQLEKEFNNETWFNKASDYIGESGINFLMFVAGYLCAKNPKC